MTIVNRICTCHSQSQLTIAGMSAGLSGPGASPADPTSVPSTSTRSTSIRSTSTEPGQMVQPTGGEGSNVVEIHAVADRAGKRSRWLPASEAGMATAEYAIATLAAVGFAGLLVFILRSDEVRGFLLTLIRTALALP